MPDGLNLLRHSHMWSKYKQDKENIVADALSRRYVLLNSLDAKLLGFEQLKEMYETTGPYYRQDVLGDFCVGSLWVLRNNGQACKPDEFVCIS